MRLHWEGSMEMVKLESSNSCQTFLAKGSILILWTFKVVLPPASYAEFYPVW
jgi:hypothetical protein